MPSTLIANPSVIDKEKKLAMDEPMFLVKKGFLRIRTKSGDLIYFKLNTIQKKICDQIRALQREGRPIRIWVLKARQMGISTCTEAIIYSHTSQKNNMNALIMADEKSHSNNLFEMTKLYQEQLEITDPHLTPKLKQSNEKKLVFDEIHSQIIIATAENLEAAISHTFQYVHLSEVAYFRDLATLMNNLNQSVPDLPNSMIIGETTANGMNLFYQEWKKAVKGLTNWVPLFLPWFDMEEYRKPLEGKLYPIDGIIFDDINTKQRFLQEETELRDDYGLDEEQINWRRYKIANGFTEDKDRGLNPIDLFRQYFPATWQEAFLMSGAKFFPKHGLAKQRTKQKEPIAVGEIVSDGLDYTFREVEYGRIKIYEWPDPTEDYILTGDPSEAIGQDEASLFVGNNRLNTTAAVVSGQYTCEELALMAVMLGKYFHDAYMAVENNSGYGIAFYQNVYKKYGNIHRCKKLNKSNSLDGLGFNANSSTRPEMLSYMREEVRIGSTFLYDENIIDQCDTFIINPNNKKAEAEEGEEDGLVISRAIFSAIRKKRHWVDRESEEMDRRMESSERREQFESANRRTRRVG